MIGYVQTQSTSGKSRVASTICDTSPGRALRKVPQQINVHRRKHVDISRTVHNHRWLIMAHVIVKFRDRAVDVLTHSPREGIIGITANDFDLMITGGTVLFAQPIVFKALKTNRRGATTPPDCSQMPGLK
ncbi:Uncharacterised protein [Klebsiella variicola]|uniref:Uncharacterized protein n=1 Tax=Klebsiella variicola TaxID=244366 RepID=A0A7H4MP65_KLEVA|nr:Uncharacterised protein [Klebsiella variicola]